MAGKAEALAKQFETKVQEATTVLERVSDADWRKVTGGEQWSVAVTAHHIASGHAGIAQLMKTVADGGSVGNFTLDMLHEMNAQHAHEFANVGKSETLALHKANAASAAALVRGLSDAQLARSGTVLSGNPPMTVEQIVTGILIGHIDDHMGSIRKTIA